MRILGQILRSLNTVSAALFGTSYVHLQPGVTGKGTVAEPYVWDGTIVLGTTNVLRHGRWRLTAPCHMVGTHTAVVGKGVARVDYTGAGDAFRVHDSQAGDPDAPVDSLPSDTFHQKLENVWIHAANGTAGGPAVAGSAVDLMQCHNAVLRDVRVSGRWTNGIYVGNTTNCHIERPMIAGSDPAQYDWNLADSPDYGIRFGKRSGDGFGAQNTNVQSPWVRFCKLDGAYWETGSGAFGVSFKGGQVGDNGRHNFHTEDGTNESITLDTIDAESSVTPVPAAIDPDGNIITVSIRGRGHRLVSVHTFGSIYLNDCQWCHVDRGRAQMIWLQNSVMTEITHTFLIGGHGRYWDVGLATGYKICARIDSNEVFNDALGVGDFDASPKQFVSYHESMVPRVHAADGANDSFWRVTRAGTTDEAHVGIIGTGGHRAGFTAGDAFVVPKDNGKGVAGGYNQAANGPGYRMFQGTFTVDRDLATLRNVSAGGTVASTGDLVAGNGHVASGQLDLQFYAGAGTNSTAVLRVFPFGAFADGVQSGFFQEPYNSRMLWTGNSGNPFDRFAVCGNYIHLSDWAYNGVPAPQAGDVVVAENRNTAANSPLTARGSALGQTGPLQRWQDKSPALGGVDVAELKPDGSLYLRNTTAANVATPANGVTIFAEGGVIKQKTSAGTVSTL